jgi:hypothetical protein
MISVLSLAAHPGVGAGEGIGVRLSLAPAGAADTSETSIARTQRITTEKYRFIAASPLAYTCTKGRVDNNAAKL